MLRELSKLINYTPKTNKLFMILYKYVHVGKGSIVPLPVPKSMKTGFYPIHCGYFLRYPLGLGPIAIPTSQLVHFSR